MTLPALARAARQPAAHNIPEPHTPEHRQGLPPAPAPAACPLAAASTAAALSRVCAECCASLSVVCRAYYAYAYQCDEARRRVGDGATPNVALSRQVHIPIYTPILHTHARSSIHTLISHIHFTHPFHTHIHTRKHTRMHTPIYTPIHTPIYTPIPNTHFTLAHAHAHAYRAKSAPPSGRGHHNRYKSAVEEPTQHGHSTDRDATRKGRHSYRRGRSKTPSAQDMAEGQGSENRVHGRGNSRFTDERGPGLQARP